MYENLRGYSERQHAWRRPVGALLALCGALSLLTSDASRQEPPRSHATDGYYPGSISSQQEEIGARPDAGTHEKHGLPARLRLLVEEGCRAYEMYHKGGRPTHVEDEHSLLAAVHEAARRYDAIQARTHTEGFADNFIDEASRQCPDVVPPDRPKFEG